jgi:nickel/cobalt exporter
VAQRRGEGRSVWLLDESQHHIDSVNPMNEEIWILSGTAATIGFIHTVVGPDHYVPFIMMSQAQNWSRAKTLLVTFFCGIGHVLSSVVLGFIGIAFGIALHKLEVIESIRGDIAAWVLIAFGLLYGIWGLKYSIKAKTHTHAHVHLDGEVHEHTHEHTHLFGNAHTLDHHKIMTTWALFTIFVFGPCEPLIPIVMYPAAQHNALGVVVVTAIFGAVTISTMMGIVMLLSSGVERLPLHALERYTHAIAGGVIAITGVAIKALGL